MTILDLKLDAQRLSYILKELERQRLRELRQNTIIKNNLKQKIDEDYFKAKYNLTLRPLSPEKKNKPTLDMQAQLQRALNIKNSPHKYLSPNRPRAHDLKYEHKLKLALQKFKHRKLCKKHKKEHQAALRREMLERLSMSPRM